MGWMTCAEAARRASTSWWQRSVSQSEVGGGDGDFDDVVVGHAGLGVVEEAGHGGLGMFLGAGEGGVAADDGAVVGEADPAAVGVLALGVQHEEHRALGADVAVGGGVVAHQDLAVPEAQLAAPEVAAAFVLGAALEGFDLDGGAVLGESDGLGGDQLLAFVEGLPGGPPGAVELDPVAEPPASSSRVTPSAAARRCATPSAGGHDSWAGLGEGGADASLIPGGQRGVGLLLAEDDRPDRLKGFYLGDEDVQAIAERAAARRADDWHRGRRRDRVEEARRHDRDAPCLPAVRRCSTRCSRAASDPDAVGAVRAPGALGGILPASRSGCAARSTASTCRRARCGRCSRRRPSRTRRC